MAVIVSRGAPAHLRSAAVEAVVTVGCTVKAHDRMNYGTVTRSFKVNGTKFFTVYFRNPETGADAEVDFYPHELTFVKGAKR